MKILHVVQGYSPVVGGTEHVVQRLSEQLVQTYGDEVTVFTTNAAKNCEMFWLKNAPTVPVGEEWLNGVRVRRFPVFNRWGRLRHLISQMADRLNLPYQDWWRALFNGPLIFNMTQAIADSRAEVIMASSFPFLHMYYALWGGQRGNIPVALFGALHTTATWSFERPMMYQAIRQTEAYIANTTYEKSYLIERNIDAKKITSIGPAINLEQFTAADGSILRRQYGWGDSPVVAYVGHLTQRKGVLALLKAMPIVWAANPTVKLLLAGTPTEAFTPTLEKWVAQFTQQQPNRVVVKENFTETEKANLFATCDILVFPSQEESFGIVFLEAWACYKPVIGVNIAAIPSVVTHNKDGLLVEPDNIKHLVQTISVLLNNPDYRHQLGQAGYQKVKQTYTWDIVTAKFRAVYQTIL